MVFLCSVVYDKIHISSQVCAEFSPLERMLLLEGEAWGGLTLIVHLLSVMRSLLGTRKSM